MSRKSILKVFLSAAVALTGWGMVSGQAQAGALYLSGHDILLHGGQNGYDDTILNYLRSDPGDVIAQSSYRIGQIGTSSTDAGGGTFGTFTEMTMASFADGAAFSTFLSTVDVLVIPWYYDLGDGTLSDSQASDKLNSFSAEIEAFFNAGGDIYANSAHTFSTYYDFLPPSAAASGPSISGSSGFTATAAGTAIGITDNMINGFPTHNSFTSLASAFTVFETRGSETISIGLQGGSIDDEGEITTTVPEPVTLAVFGFGLAGLGLMRRRRAS